MVWILILFINEENVKVNTTQIKKSLEIIKAASADETVINEAQKIEAAVNQLVAVNQPLVTAYAENLKAFNESLVSRYGKKTASVIEFVMLAAVAAKMFLL
jgi:hypothetical protein